MSNSAKSTTKTDNSLDPWSQAQYTDLAGQISGKVNQPVAAYTGPMAAGLDPSQTAAASNVQNNLGAGQASVAAGQDANKGMLSYAAQSVAPQPMTGATVAPASTYSATGYAPSMASAAKLGATAMAGSQGYTAANATGNGYTAAQVAPTSIDPAHLAAASSADRSQIGNVGAGMLDGARISALENPYTNDVVNSSINDLDHARQRTISDTQGQATQAGAYGGTREGVADSLTNKNYLDQVAQLSSSLRSQGYDTAAGLAQGEAQRAQTGEQSNQSADLATQSLNANLSQAAGLANAGAENNRDITQAGLTQTGNLADQAAVNSASQFGANAGNTASLADQAAQDQAAQFGATAGNAASSQNASALNTATLNQGALDQATGLANQEAGNTAGQFGAAAANTAAGVNAGAINTQHQTQAGLDQATATTNANNNLQGQVANQNADLSAAGLRNSATGMAGSLGQLQQQLGLNDTSALEGVGAVGQNTSQQALTDAYNEFVRQQGQGNTSTQQLLALLGMTPMVQDGTNTTKQSSFNPLGWAQFLLGSGGSGGSGGAAASAGG